MIPRIKRRIPSRSSHFLNVILAVVVDVTALKDDLPEGITTLTEFPGSVVEQCARVSRIQWPVSADSGKGDQTIIHLVGLVESSEMLRLIMKQLVEGDDSSAEFGQLPRRLHVFLLALRAGVIGEFVTKIRDLRSSGAKVEDSTAYASGRFLPTTLSCYLLDRYRTSPDWQIENCEVVKKLLVIPSKLYEETEELIEAIERGDQFKCTQRCSKALTYALDACAVPEDGAVDLTRLEDDCPLLSQRVTGDAYAPVATVTQLFPWLEQARIQPSSPDETGWVRMFTGTGQVNVHAYSFINWLKRIPALTSETEMADTDSFSLTPDLMWQYWAVKDGWMTEFVRRVRNFRAKKWPVRAKNPNGGTTLSAWLLSAFAEGNPKVQSGRVLIKPHRVSMKRREELQKWPVVANMLPKKSDEVHGAD